MKKMIEKLYIEIFELEGEDLVLDIIIPEVILAEFKLEKAEYYNPKPLSYTRYLELSMRIPKMKTHPFENYEWYLQTRIAILE